MTAIAAQTGRRLAPLALAAAAALVAAAPAAAHPEPGEKGEKRVEQVIILADHDKGNGAHAKGERVRTFRVVTADGRPHTELGKPGEHRFRVLSPESCDGDKSEVSETSPDGKEKTRILVCGKSMTAAERAEKLEKALARLQENDRLSAEHKERVTAALREEIERLRNTR